MRPQFNGLSLLAMLGLIGFLAFVEDSYDSRVAMSFGYFFYLIYLWVRPDELFWQYVLKAAAYTMALSLILMSVWVALYYVMRLDESFIFMGFWVMYSLLHIGFNSILAWFISMDQWHA